MLNLKFITDYYWVGQLNIEQINEILISNSCLLRHVVNSMVLQFRCHVMYIDSNT